MHPKVLSKEAWRTVRQLVGEGVVDTWTLAGGTGLALQLGHRYSEDLDFFRDEAFDVDAAIGRLARIGKVQVQSRTEDSLHVLLDGLRLSFLRA
ncbi:MAG: nucleotidyl transferase AbiEii/AbiGii toxin family protein, partial [Thermoanaerobaculia bacterium]